MVMLIPFWKPEYFSGCTPPHCTSDPWPPAPEQEESHPAVKAKTKPPAQRPASTAEGMFKHTKLAESREELITGAWRSELWPSQRWTWPPWTQCCAQKAAGREEAGFGQTGFHTINSTFDNPIFKISITTNTP